MDFVTLPVVAPLALVGSGFIGQYLKNTFGDAFRPSLTQKELDVALAKALESDEGKTELQRLFESIDKDGDGKVTSTEWAKAVGTQGSAMRKFFGSTSLDDIAKQFARLDMDGSEDLTWEEFLVGATGAAAVVKVGDALSEDKGMAEWKNLFDELDADEDGRVTYLEWGLGVFKNQKTLKKFYGVLAATSNPKQTVAYKGVALEKAKAAKAAEEAKEKTAAVYDPAVKAADQAETSAQAASTAASEAVTVKTAADEALAAAKATLADASEALAANQATPKKEKKKAKLEEPKIRAALEEAEKEEAAAQKKVDAVTKEATAKALERDQKAKAAKDARETVVTLQQQMDSDSAAALVLAAEEEAAQQQWQRCLKADQACVAAIAKTFAKLDVDKTGALSWDEFLAGAALFSSAGELDA